MESSTISSHVQLDLRHEVCPFSFVRTKLKLEEMEPGQVLEVTLRGAAIENVPRSVKEEGHSIVHVRRDGDNFVFYIRKNPSPERRHACAQKDCFHCRDILKEKALDTKKTGAGEPDPLLRELQAQAEKLESASAEETLRWALNFFGDRVALATSFSAEDMVITDMLSGMDGKARIFTLDTGRLHQETYDVMDRAAEKYGLRIEVFAPNAREVEELTKQYGPNLFYRSIENRISCCQVRKINPLKRALSTLDAWICGLRREQSPTRTDVRKLEIGGDNGIKAKICPLADWTEKDVWDYIRKNDVPYNELHERGYPSIGCAPCTRPVNPGEDVRAGRWWWEAPEMKECGLHKKGK
ncbi:MAG: phosphoadenylyl-sulfate reductase [bacterium]